MTSSLNIKRYTEYSLLVSILCTIFALIIFKTEELSPVLLLFVAITPLIIYLGSQKKGAFLILYLLLCITFLENNEGIEPIEIPFYFASCLLVGYAGLKIITGNIIIETTLDRLFLFLSVLIPFAVLYGIVNGSSPYTAMGEATNYFGVYLYFPVREHIKHKAFRKVVFWVLLVFMAFVAIRNLYFYREILIQATLPWQAENARVAANEFILLFGCCLSVSFAAITKHPVKQIIFTGLFVITLGMLILTQSRGYWIAFFMGLLLIFAVIHKRGKIKITYTAIILLTTVVTIASIYFSGLFSTVMEGLANRFQSLASGKLDISLLERYLESKTVLNLISFNPIAGYGFGYTYTKKILFFDHFIETSYVHNGYLAAWFKFGIMGLLTILSIWILNIKYGIQVYRKSPTLSHKAVAITIAGTVFGLLFVNNTSPQVLTFESLLIVVLGSTFLSNQITELRP
ncbi:O-antigen ligase family protein [Gracilimonas sp.]|uniref:O-antigen ligase family protein n=1 Tax=Gracilimonas sp. TaxID=1974203 RepID=UPI003D130E39